MKPLQALSVRHKWNRIMLNIMRLLIMQGASRAGLTITLIGITAQETIAVPVMFVRDLSVQIAVANVWAAI